MTTSPTERCLVIPAGESYLTPQGLLYTAGVFAENAQTRAISMQLVTIPPGGKAKAHSHPLHETAVYVVSGTIEVWSGTDLQHVQRVQAGDFMYIPAGVPHMPRNPSASETALAVLARTDPHVDEHVELLPELDARVP